MVGSAILFVEKVFSETPYCTYLERLFDIAVSGLGVLGKKLLQIVPWYLPGPLNRPVFPHILWSLGG